MSDTGEIDCADPNACRGAMALAPGEAHLWFAWTDRCCTPARLACYRSLLCEEELRRHDRYAFEHLRHEFLLTRALCRLTLSRYADVAPAAWRFDANAFGRPGIAGPDPSLPLRFNLSNTRGLVACVVAREIEIGVDVEQTGRDNDILDLAGHYFSASEVQALRALPQARQRQRFFELWTLKESYIKARGQGLSIPLDRFSIELDRAPPIRVVFDPRLSDSGGDWQFELFAPGQGFLMAVGLRRGAGPDVSIRLFETIPGAEAVEESQQTP